MATVLISSPVPDVLTEPPLPAVCLKTGVPTGDRVRVRGRAAPSWAGATIVFGLVAWLFVSSASSRSYDILVPFRAEAWQRYRTLRRAASVTFWAGIVLAGVVGVAGASAPWMLLLLSVVGLAMFVVNDWRNSFGVRLGRDGALALTRVHRDFAAAAEGRQDQSAPSARSSKIS